MKINQVREMADADLQTSLKDNFEALENFRFRHAIGQLENYKSLSNTKKDIAKILTIIRERELNINMKLKKESVSPVKKTEKNAVKKTRKKTAVKEAEAEETPENNQK